MVPPGPRSRRRSRYPADSNSRNAREIRISPSVKCSHSAAMLTGAPSGSEEMYVATPIVTALPRRCARSLASTVKSAVRRVRTWITPEVGAPASARLGALDCGSAIGKLFLPDRSGPRSGCQSRPGAVVCLRLSCRERNDWRASPASWSLVRVSSGKGGWAGSSLPRFFGGVRGPPGPRVRGPGGPGTTTWTDPRPTRGRWWSSGGGRPSTHVKGLTPPRGPAVMLGHCAYFRHSTLALRSLPYPSPCR